jgi:drug/metabolite transporter (DMT)-like permease
VAALGLAAVVLAERPSLAQLAGAVLVCGGVLAASWAAPASRRRGRRGTPPVTEQPVR